MASTDGLLLVDKPAGMTSHDVVMIARRALAERRIGHGGTLDPFTTGLLVLLIGRATRLLRFLPGEPKVYEATIRFGAETDTDDLTGAVIRQAPLPQPAAVENAIRRLTGTIEQVPPDYSAKQMGGRRAYQAARAGAPLALAPAPVHVFGWHVRARRADEWEVTIECGAGTYIRALARDVGRLADSAAHLSALRRTRSGPFDVAMAVPPDRISRATLRPARDAVALLPAEKLSDEAVARAVHGGEIPASIDGSTAALIASDGSLVGIGERRGTQWHPRVVLRDA